MKKIIALTSLLIIIATGSLTAQNKSSVKMGTSEESCTDYSANRNVVKLNPLLFFRGDVPIYYERSLTDKVALEMGVGFTMKDYMNYNYFTEGFEYEENDQIGYSVRLGLRYYASDYSYMQEGFYFGFNARYQSYKSDFTFIDGFPYNDSNNSSNLDFRLHIGYLHMWEENFFIEPYVAFGFRNRTFEEITYYGEVAEPYSTDTQTEVNPIFSIGFKLGITFD